MGRRRGTAGAALLALASVGLPEPAPAVEPQVIQSERHAFRVVVLVEGLENPWGLAFLPDGRLLVTERPGRLRLVANGTLDPQPIGGLPAIAVPGQGGLPDVALHPRYPETGWVYLSYAARGEGGAAPEVLRGRLRGGQLADVEVLFRLQPKSGGGQHFGSRLVFDRAGHLYVTLGDRGERHAAQASTTTEARSSGFATTAVSRPTIHSGIGRGSSPRSSRSGTGTCRERPSTRRPGSSGPTSTGRRAATR